MNPDTIYSRFSESLKKRGRAPACARKGDRRVHSELGENRARQGNFAALLEKGRETAKTRGRSTACPRDARGARDSPIVFDTSGRPPQYRGNEAPSPSRPRRQRRAAPPRRPPRHARRAPRSQKVGAASARPITQRPPARRKRLCGLPTISSGNPRGNRSVDRVWPSNKQPAGKGA